MIFKNIFCKAAIAALLLSMPLAANTWQLFFYMDASDGLSDMAFKNITGLMRGKSNDNVDVMIQLHAYDSVALRYQVTSAGLVFLEELSLSGDSKQDFINAASWAFADNKADHTMLVFSNHGWGALDPRWNAETNAWEVAGLSLSNSPSTVCPLSKKQEKIRKEIHKQHKGFMFNAQHSYLTNQELAQGLAYVQENVLRQKIDIVAFDTCMGSMLEVATCVAPYAYYLVGVQSCALRDGFDYQGFMAILSQGIDPRSTAASFVTVFDNYYREHDAAGIYTFAALDMLYIDAVNEALNNVVKQLLGHEELLPLLMQARAESPRFCLWPIYTDLVAFCKLVEMQLVKLPVSESRALLIQSLHALYTAAETMVVARCGGQTTTGSAHGFSIYLPGQDMENSYCNSVFAQHSLWPQLLIALSN